MQALLYTISIIIWHSISSIARRFWGNLKEFLDQEITNITKSQKLEILEMQVMPDHIHLFVACDPLASPTIVKMFKGITARKHSKDFQN
ncbi:transposase [Nitrosopumilus sp.]|uniref:transposase n=1 Tax=Nitrosopumilus sp. TaxID=2024843 RepID=UPI0034A06FDB